MLKISTQYVMQVTLKTSNRSGTIKREVVFVEGVTPMETLLTAIKIGKKRFHKVHSIVNLRRDKDLPAMIILEITPDD